MKSFESADGSRNYGLEIEQAKVNLAEAERLVAAGEATEDAIAKAKDALEIAEMRYNRSQQGWNEGAIEEVTRRYEQQSNPESDQS